MLSPNPARRGVPHRPPHANNDFLGCWVRGLGFRLHGRELELNYHDGKLP